jgi:hypothetical protein
LGGESRPFYIHSVFRAGAAHAADGRRKMIAINFPAACID